MLLSWPSNKIKDSYFAEVLEVQNPSPREVNERRTLSDFTGIKIYSKDFLPCDVLNVLMYWDRKLLLRKKELIENHIQKLLLISILSPEVLNKKQEENTRQRTILSEYSAMPFLKNFQNFKPWGREEECSWNALL